MDPDIIGLKLGVIGCTIMVFGTWKMCHMFVLSLGMEMLHFVNCTCSIHIAAAHVKERYNIHSWRIEFITG